MIAARRCVCFLCAALLAAPQAFCGETPAYRTFVPTVSFRLSSLSDAVNALHDALSGIGVENSSSDSEKSIASVLMLPSLNGADMTGPVRFFLLSRDQSSVLPVPAVIMPVRRNGEKDIIHALCTRYSRVEGGNVKVCYGPIDGKAVEPLYVAIAEHNAMISTDFDAVRWMAYNLQSRSVPEIPVFRKAIVSASADGPRLGRFLGLLASTLPPPESEDVTPDNIALHLREASSFVAAFSRIDLSATPSIKQFDIAAKLVPPEGTMSAAIRSFKPPAEKWARFFPAFAYHKAASALPALTALLPEGNKRWLAGLADNTCFMGMQILPAAFDLDEALRPLTAGTGLSSFVVDRPGGRIGSISIVALQHPAKAEGLIRDYFSAKGAAVQNRRMRNVAVRDDRGVFAYDFELGDQEETSGGNAGVALSQLFDLNHVEVAVRDDRLIVVRGSSRLIDGWLNDTHLPSWDEDISALTGIFPAQPGEIVLGGGSMEPVALVKKIVEAAPNISYLAAKLPHAGNGLAWRMSRRDGEAVFDLRIYANEILAFNMLRGLDATTTQELLSQLALGNFRKQSGGKSRNEIMKESLEELRKH